MTTQASDFMQIVPGSGKCINGHPAVETGMALWRCAEPSCEYAVSAESSPSAGRKQDLPQASPTPEDQLDEILECFYRNYETDIAAVVPPIGQITDIEEQNRQSSHFWNKRIKQAKAQLLQIIAAEYQKGYNTGWQKSKRLRPDIKIPHIIASLKIVLTEVEKLEATLQPGNKT